MCRYEELSPNLQHSCKKQGIVKLYTQERSLGLTDCQPSSRFSARLCLKGVRESDEVKHPAYIRAVPVSWW